MDTNVSRPADFQAAGMILKRYAFQTAKIRMVAASWTYTFLLAKKSGFFLPSLSS
jgi:hypothetical protein